MYHLIVAMEQFRFDNLTEDDQLELLKYMSNKERVQFERINTEWASLLERIWLSEKQLNFGSGARIVVKCHPISRIQKYPRNGIPVEVMLKITSKCKNLNALVLTDCSPPFAKRSFATQFARVLNDNCRGLEHLDAPHVHSAFFKRFLPSDKLTCLLPSERLNILYDKKPPVNPLPMKLISLNRHCPLTWDMINKQTVEEVEASEWNDKFNELINVRSLQVLHAKSNQIGHFHQLERIKLFRASPTELRRIFENNLKLVSLTFWFPSEEYRLKKCDQIINTIFEFGGNLKKLELNDQKGVAIGDFVFWQKFAKLTKLRILDIDAGENGKNELDTKIHVNGLILLLNTCTKLKSVRVKCSLNAEDIAEVEKDQIRKAVANKSFRQSFVVTFKSCCGYHTITVGLGQQSV